MASNNTLRKSLAKVAKVEKVESLSNTSLPVLSFHEDLQNEVPQLGLRASPSYPLPFKHLNIARSHKVKLLDH